MAGFLARSRDRLLLPHKIGRWRKSPSPETLAEVVPALLRVGAADEAWQFAREGRSRFPGHEVVRELWRLASRAHAEQGLERARLEVHQKPTASTFLRIARFAVLLRDVPQAFAALEECLDRFPSAATAHAALAELLERRWLRDLSAADGRAAVAHWKKAWRLDGTEAARPLKLAGFFARVGAPRAALAVLAEVLELYPGQADAAAMQDSLQAAVEAESAEDDAAVDAIEDVDLLLRQIEDQGRVASDPGDAARVARESDQLRATLPLLRRQADCERVLILEPRGAAFDERGPTGIAPLPTLAANFTRSAELAVRRADLGPLQSALLETAGGSLLLERAHRCTVAMLIDEPVRVAHGQQALAAFVAGAAAPNGSPA